MERLLHRGHYLHRTSGVVLDMNPQIYPVKCCYCDVSGGVRHEKTSRVIDGHGKFGPKETMPVFSEPITEKDCGQ